MKSTWYLSVFVVSVSLLAGYDYLYHIRVVGWNVQPVCPGGGDYVWNETWQTMESTVYGHPAAPRTEPALPETLQRLDNADTRLTFETNGLRARFRLAWTPPPADAKATARLEGDENAPQ